MTNCKYLSIFVVVMLAMAQLIVGCTTEVDYTQGSEFIPSNQKMELRRRVYKHGEMREGDARDVCALSSTSLFISDSIPSTNLKNVYFGREKSDTFGLRTAGFLTQMTFSMSLDKERGWGYRPIFDSMVMALYVNGYHGDTTYKQRFEVYEVMSNDYFELPADKDTSFYINFDPVPYISKEPIFTFTFPDQDRGVYVGDSENPDTRIVLMQETPATREYVSRLMLLDNMDANGGYAVDSDSLYVPGNEKEFFERVRGVYVMPAEDNNGRGAVYSARVEESYMYLYARSRYEEDPTIIRDTVQMGYNFYIDPTKYSLTAGNVSIGTVDHNYSEVTLFDAQNIPVDDDTAPRDIVSVGYIEGMGGVVTEVMFSDEFIQSLADVVLSNSGSVVSVNQAHLSVYVEGSDYDYTVIDPWVITPIMDAAMPSMGFYADYGGLETVSDYMHSYSGSGVLAFDGNLNRSLACYTMDISNYIQSLMMKAADNLLEDGATVDLDKFSPTSEGGVSSLVKYRRFYIGPSADNLFTFNRQSVIGGDIVEEGVAGNAPITLELVYTIVK